MWQFTGPRLVFGPGAIEFLATLKSARTLVVADRALVKAGMHASVMEQVAKGGGKVELFGEVDPEPLVSRVLEGVEVAKSFAPDTIVGLGGGSAMDVAKAIYALYERPDLTVYELTPLVEMKLGQKCHLIQIPTTSGTGSETTWATILTEGEGGRKLELAHRELVAEWAVLDPLLPSTMPPKLTADTGADALCHAIESVSSEWSNPFSDALAKEAVSLIFGHLPTAVKDPTNHDAREAMHYASTMAGLSFGNAQVGVGHALGHALGSVFHIPHGRAVGLFLPYAVEFNFQAASKKFAALSATLGEEAVRGPTDLSARVRKLWDEIGMSKTIPEIGGVTSEAFERALPELVTRADESTCVTTNPRMPSSKDLEGLFRAAWEGRAANL